MQDRIRQTLQGFYGVLKNADKYIKFAFLTGVTEYGKLGIFSAANNPKNLSITDDYSSICGITEEELHRYFDDEIQLFAEKLKVSKDRMYQLLKLKYDGYHFSAISDDVYNPFSLLNALSDRQLTNYWFSTGTPTYLTRILKKKTFDLSKFSDGVYATETNIKSFGNGEENITAALYQSGYLTIKGYEDGAYMLGFPNEEVADGFVQYLLVEFSGQSMDSFDADIIKLRRLIRTEDVDGFMAQIQLVISQIPFESKDVKLIEANFRNMIYLLIRATGHNVFVEHPVLGGRIDIFFETERCAYIIECKRDGSAQDALSQIDEKKYAKRIRHVHLKDIRPDVVAKVKAEKMSFLQGVRKGTFTVPGDGVIDFAPIFEVLAENNYEGYVLVEAEQDPAIANPFEYALKARKYIADKAGL